MRLTRWIGASLALASIGMVEAVGAAVAVIPLDYGVLLTAGTPGPGFTSLSGFGTAALSGPVGSSSASAGSQPSPFVSAQVSSNIPSGYPSLDVETSANAQFGYSFTVSGPAGVLVPLWLSASGSVTRNGSRTNSTVFSAAAGVLRITPQNQQSVFAREFCTGFGASQYPTNPLNPTPCADIASGSATVDFSVRDVEILVPANRLIFVDLQAIAVATRQGTASVFVDPYLQIAPGFADAALYSLQFSTGIEQNPPSGGGTPGGGGSTVDSPATLALLAGGLVVFTRVHRRRRTPARAC